jgi:2-octaprenyl-6-methoxyphenol hydroxylase
MPEMHDVDVAILGAGPVGGTLACLLAAGGVRVLVVDRAPLPPMEHPAFDGRCYAIAAGSRAVLEQAGIWPALPFTPGPIRAIRVSDGQVGRPPSRLALGFRAADVGAEAFGWMVEARSLRMALNAALHRRGMVLAPAEAAVTRDDAGAVLRVAGRVVSCRLVVAAEGRLSPERHAAGIPVTRFGYGQTGMVGAIAHDLPHHGTALEHFLPAGPFAQLPMAPTDGAPHASAFVWTEHDSAARTLLTLSPERFARELRRRLGDHLGEIRLLGRRWSYPLAALHAHRYTDTRLAVVGDAAHGIHPIAGQGLNLGLRDAATLAELVTEAVATGQDCGAPDRLRRYQAWRRPANLAMLAATDALDRLFSTDNRLLRLARDLGIAGVDRLPPLKRAFVREAMGA